MKKITGFSGNVIGATIVCTTLVACGGSADRDANIAANIDEALATQSGPSSSLASVNAEAKVANDAAADVAPMLLAGVVDSTALSDLAINNAVVMSVGEPSQTIAYRFEVVDAGGADLSIDKMSVALEVAASGSFTDSYRLALFDIRSESTGQTSSTATFSARSAVTDLPSGNYLARLVVNPNWQNAFDTVPASHDDRQPFRYIEELNHSNNASNEFQIDVTNTKVCAEDGFENNDSFATATVIPVGGQIDAALCLDDVDFYSVDLAASASASLAFDYTDNEGGLKRATRYVLFDSSANRIGDGIAREANDIVINADAEGIYYLALYGQRSSHRIVRTDGPGLANDFSDDRFFRDESIIGPQSWLFGEITLNKLSFSEELLNDQVINCGQVTTQFDNEQPVAYVTPLHFAELHEFRLLTDGSYLVDGQLQAEWSIEHGDIVNTDWYTNDFPGYAEIVNINRWRYWSRDGLAYAECALELN